MSLFRNLRNTKYRDRGKMGKSLLCGPDLITRVPRCQETILKTGCGKREVVGIKIRKGRLSPLNKTEGF